MAARSTIPEKVFAYGVEWKSKIRWIDRAWGDYCYEYHSEGEPTLPTKILIVQSDAYMQGSLSNTTEEIRLYGKLIFSQSDDYGRKSVIWLSGFQNELELVEPNYKGICKYCGKQKDRNYFNREQYAHTDFCQEFCKTSYKNYGADKLMKKVLEETILAKIDEIQNREYFQNKKNNLLNMDFLKLK